MNAEVLISKEHQKALLDAALEINQPLAVVYYLKEELRQMWSQPSREFAERYIMSWITKAEQSGIQMLKRFAKSIRRHFQSILNHYDYSISTNIIEGLNNKIKTLHKQSYGFRDIEFFKLKIKAIHRAKYQLCG